MENYDKTVEKNLMDVIRQKEEADKRLLSMEYVIVGIALIAFFTLLIVATCINMQEWIKGILVGIGVLILVIACSFGIKIEQVAGYYECQKCHHRYVPTYASVFGAMHINRTRYMKCPKCGKRSWQKKVISK